MAGGALPAAATKERKSRWIRQGYILSLMPPWALRCPAGRYPPPPRLWWRVEHGAVPRLVRLLSLVLPVLARSARIARLVLSALAALPVLSRLRATPPCQDPAACHRPATPRRADEPFLESKGVSLDSKGVGKAVVNSPLFKCAVAGNDPNVGRLGARNQRDAAWVRGTKEMLKEMPVSHLFLLHLHIYQATYRARLGAQPT